MTVSVLVVSCGIGYHVDFEGNLFASALMNYCLLKTVLQKITISHLSRQLETAMSTFSFKLEDGVTFTLGGVKLNRWEYRVRECWLVIFKLNGKIIGKDGLFKRMLHTENQCMFFLTTQINESLEKNLGSEPCRNYSL